MLKSQLYSVREARHFGNTGLGLLFLDWTIAFNTKKRPILDLSVLGPMSKNDDLKTHKSKLEN